MAPEILLATPYDYSVDVFSFGVLLWEMLSGQVPYVSLTEPQIISMVAYGKKRLPLPTVTRSGDPILAEFHSLIQDCWNADRKQRPSYAEILRRLEETESQLIAAATVHNRDEDATEECDDSVQFQRMISMESTPVFFFLSVCV